MTKSKELVYYSWKPLSPEASTFPHTHTHNILCEHQEPSAHSHTNKPFNIMSEMSKILCIQWPLAPPGGKARCSCTVRPVGLAVHHRAVRGGSFVFKCSGTCQTTRVIASKTHSQSPILKCYGGCSATQ